MLITSYDYEMLGSFLLKIQKKLRSGHPEGKYEKSIGLWKFVIILTQIQRILKGSHLI